MTHRFTAGKLAVVLLATVLGLVSATRPAKSADDLDDLMGGFDDEDAGEDEGDDLMGGFGDDFGESDGSGAEDEIHPWLAAIPYGDVIAERVDLSGSLSASTAYSYLDHKVPHGDEVGRSTSWGNLTRLDLDGFLQLDVELPYDWQIRSEVQGWYDFAYRINEVLRDLTSFDLEFEKPHNKLKVDARAAKRNARSVELWAKYYRDLYSKKSGSKASVGR